MGKKGVIALIFIAIIVVIGVILAWIYSKKNKDLIKTKAKDTIANEAEKKEGEKEGTGTVVGDEAASGTTNGTTNGEVIDAGIPGTETEPIPDGSTTEPVPEPPKIDEDLEFSKTVLRVFNKDKYGIGANPILNNYKLTEYAENFIEKNNYNQTNMNLQAIGSIIVSAFPLQLKNSSVFEYNGYILLPIANTDYMLTGAQINTIKQYVKCFTENKLYIPDVLNLRLGTVKTNFQYTPEVKYDNFKTGYIKQLQIDRKHKHSITTPTWRSAGGVAWSSANFYCTGDITTQDINLTEAGDTTEKTTPVNILDRGNIVFLYLICGYVNLSKEINVGEV